MKEAIQELKNLETQLHFLKSGIPQKSCLINNEVIDILSDISLKIENTVKILQIKQGEIQSNTKVIY